MTFLVQEFKNSATNVGEGVTYSLSRFLEMMRSGLTAGRPLLRFSNNPEKHVSGANEPMTKVIGLDTGKGDDLERPWSDRDAANRAVTLLFMELPQEHSSGDSQ